MSHFKLACPGSSVQREEHSKHFVKIIPLGRSRETSREGLTLRQNLVSLRQADCQVHPKLWTQFLQASWTADINYHCSAKAL